MKKGKLRLMLEDSNIKKLIGVSLLILTISITSALTTNYQSTTKDIKETKHNKTSIYQVAQGDYINNSNEEKVNIQKEEQKEEYQNNTINIDTILNKPIIKDQTGDAYYLNHDINGNYDGIGIPYIDYRTNFYTRKTLIYSHSSPDGNGNFQVLQNYHNNKDFYNKHKYITVNYNNVIYKYEIFSVYVSLADSEESEGLEFFHVMDYTDSEWLNKLNEYKKNSEYETGVNISSNDKIIILQTCSMDPKYYEKYYRYNLLIMGKLI